MRRRVPLKDRDGYYHREPNLWYRCLKCGIAIPADPPESIGCKCGNVYIDVGYGRLSIENEALVEAFVEGPNLRP